MTTTNEKQPNKFQPAGRVKEVKGSILTPENGGLRFILSLANLAGKNEGNPLLPIFDRKWPKVKAEARALYATKTGAYKLGKVVGTTATQSDVWIIHCLVQDEQLNVDLNAVSSCLKEVCKMAKYEKASIHVSSLLTNLIPELPDLLQQQVVSQGVAVSFYEEPNIQ
jgi:hypothetical protein